jgi:dTDP-glucose 4,6-dehydratase
MAECNPERILVTGGCGFVGSNFVRHLLHTRPSVSVVNLDVLTYAGNPENLRDIERDPRYRFVHGDINDRRLVVELLHETDAVVHLAAETHVDRSIEDASPFVRTNVAGTQALLDAARRAWSAGGDGLPPFRGRFVHVSTDEVYGPLGLDPSEPAFHEGSPCVPSSPYAATKAAGDMLIVACHRTFGLDVLITRSSNNFGPWQFPEKVVPLFVTRLLEDRTLPLYGDGQHVRDWLHVLDHADALLAVLERGSSGAIYNVGADNPQSNLELARALLEITGHGEEKIERVADRPGHDLRYALDTRKIRRELGWEPRRSQWPEALAETVGWYASHESWWRRIRSGAHRRERSWRAAE